MAYGRKYYKEFDGYNAATRQSYSVLVDIYEDGFAGSAIEIEEISASPLQLSLDSSGDPLYTAIKKTSATFNIINTNQFDYSEFYTSNAKKYKMMITSTVFNWTGYLVPQAVSFDLATNGEFSLTASDGLHLLQSIDYVAAENDMTTLAAFLADIETKIGLSTFNRSSTINTEYGDIWNSLIYEGMFTNKTYEEAFEMVLKAIGMQVRYWKITPIISIESALQTASVKCVNDYPELNFLAPIKTAKLTKNITTLPNALSGALVDDAKDLMVRTGGYYTLKNWVPASDNGVICSIGQMYTGRFQDNKYTDINVFTNPTNYTYAGRTPPLSAGSYYKLRKVKSTALSLTFSANFGRIGTYQKFDDGYTTTICPVKWASIRWGLYDEINDRSFNILTGDWDIVGVPTRTNSNELRVTNPADSYTDILVEVAYLSSFTESLRFYLFQGQVEYNDFSGGYDDRKLPVLSIKSIKLDGEDVVQENELYTSVTGNVAVGDNIDKLDYDVDFGSVPVPPLNTSLYYGSAFFDNNLNQLSSVIIGVNTVSHEQYLFNTILYTQNEIRKKVYTANVNMLTNVSPFWLKTTLKTDTVMVNACSFDFKTSQLNGEFTEIVPYVYREWAITSESEIGSSDWGGSGGQTGGSSGGGTVDTSNFVVKTGATSQTVEGDFIVNGNIISTGEVSAYGAGSGTGGGSGLITSVLGSAGLGGSYLDSDLTNTFNAYTINLINNNLTSALGRIGALETSTPNVAWGIPTSQYSPLTINSVTRNLSVDGHTHSYLPLTGGVLSNSVTNIISLYNNTGTDVSIVYQTNYISKYLGFNNGVLKIADTTDLSSGNKVWHAGNDGAGSGLDADLLRGVAPSNLAVASATKLANTRTIWGQNFNGEGDVTGSINIGGASINGTAGNLFFGGNFHIDSIGGNKLYLNYYNGTDTIINAGSSQGSVLIGTSTNSGYKFDVNGSVRTGTIIIDEHVSDAGLKINNNSNTYSRIRFFDSDDNVGTIHAFTGNQFLFNNQKCINIGTISAISLGPWYDPNVYINAVNGCVGISNTNPQYKLDVNGNTRVTGNLIATGEVTAYSASDVRLKTEVVTLRDSLRIIELLNPVSYKWNSIAKELNPLKDNNTDYGLIAQELETVMPELVHTVYGQYKSVDYVKIIPHLICAIKQLKSEIDMLKS